MPAKVLVADDSPTIRRRATTTLSEAGYQVTCVEDGLAAWNLLQAGETFSVVLCDILMPGIDGYELCRRVKSDAGLSSVPVLLLRGTFEPWDQAKAVDAGADGYVTKPFDAEALLSTLGEVLADVASTSGPAIPQEIAPEMPIPQAPPAAPLPSRAPEPPMPVPEPLADSLSEPAPPAVASVADSPFGATEPPAVAEAAPLADVFETPAAAEGPLGEGPLGDLGASPFGEAEPIAGDSGPLGGLAAPAANPATPEPWAPVDRAPVAAPPPPPPVSTTVTPPPPPAPIAMPAPAAPAMMPGAFALDDAMIERIAERVAARLTGGQIEKIAWEVVPDMAEALIRKRLTEIEAQLGDE